MLINACRTSLFFVLIFFAAFAAPSSFFTPLATRALGSDEPFTGPANWGGTGLMEIPTARIMKEDTYRLGAGQVHPYRYYYAAMSPFDGVEIDGRFTEIIGVAALTSGYGSYKDKALDFKFRVLEEGKYSPALALGIMDPQGTRLYPSQYLVASKQIFPFDFTLGFGNGRFGKNPLPSSQNNWQAEIFTNPQGWLKDAQMFWGIQVTPSEKYSFMVEYNPIRYEKQTDDPAQSVYFQKPVASKFNFGFRWRPYKWAEIDLTYQRGSEIGVNFSTVFNMGKPFIPIYDKPYREKKEDRLNPVEKRLEKALYESGFSNIGITIEGDTLRVEAENNKYYYTTKAVSVILKLVYAMTPPQVKKIDVVITQEGIPLLELSALREDLREFYREKLTRSEFLFLSRMNTDVYKRPDVEIKHRRWISFGLKPAFEPLVNDPNQFFMYRLGLDGWGQLHPWEGFTVMGALQGYALNDIKTSTSSLADAVRSDIWLYKGKNMNMGRLMAEQIYKSDHQVYAKLSGGYLEIEYAGLDGEVAMPLLGGRVLVGLGGSVVRKRDPDSAFKLKADNTRTYHTAFFNTRFNVPEVNIAVDFKTGVFMAGDYGTVITLSKNINGLLIYGWYSFTNTNMMTDPENRGYNDKGIGISLPLRLFDGKDSKTAYNYAVSPWTRDVAQDIDHFTRLFDFIGRNLPVFWERDAREMK